MGDPFFQNCFALTHLRWLFSTLPSSQCSGCIIKSRLTAHFLGLLGLECFVCYQIRTATVHFHLWLHLLKTQVSVQSDFSPAAFRIAQLLIFISYAMTVLSRIFLRCSQQILRIHSHTVHLVRTAFRLQKRHCSCVPYWRTTTWPPSFSISLYAYIKVLASDSLAIQGHLRLVLLPVFFIVSTCTWTVGTKRLNLSTVCITD